MLMILEKMAVLAMSVWFLALLFTPCAASLHPLPEVTKEIVAATRAIDSSSRAPVDVYFKDGDIILGGVFPLHTYDERTRECSAIRDVRALKLVEAMAYAVDRLNNGTVGLLPGLSLGFEVYDSCYSDIWTLKQALNFMPPEERRACSGAGGWPGAWSPSDDDTCLHQKRVAGVVGSQRSSSSAELAILLGLYQIPQISYLSTLDSLNEVAYPFFLRVVPSDRHQVNAIMDFVQHFGWTYISLLFSSDEYGENGYYELTRQAATHDICWAYTRDISTSYTAEYYDDIVADLRRDPFSRAKVVVLFAHLAEARMLLSAVKRNQAVGEFTFVASDGIGNFGRQGLEGVLEPAMGMITMVPYSERLPDFFEFFVASWTADNPNPWTKEYMEEYTWCDVVGGLTCPENETNLVSPHETLVIDSVYAFAHALDTMLRAECSDVTNLSACALVDKMDGLKLMSYLKNTSFESLSNGHVFFDENGDGNVRYKIRNLNNALGGTSFVDVGSWQGIHDEIDINRFLIRFYTNDTGGSFGAVPSSVCSLPCPLGSRKEFFAGQAKCCWHCLECEANATVVDDGSVCRECAAPEWPNVNRTECVELEAVAMSWDTVEGTVIIMLALLALVEASAVILLYFTQFRRRIIRSSDPMLCAFIHAGLCLLIVGALSTTFTPSPATCAFARMSPSVAFALIFVPFAHKSARLYRVFVKARDTGSEEEAHLWGLKAQLLLVLFFWIIEISISILWILLFPPEVRYIFRPHEPPTEGGLSVALIVTCNYQVHETVTELCFSVALLLATVVLNLLARTLPDNYHEARFCVFASAGSLLVFTGTYAASFGTTKTGLYVPIMYRSLGMIVNAALIMTCLFAPKIYVIFFVRGDIDEVMLRKRQSLAVLSVYRVRASTAGSATVALNGDATLRGRTRSARSSSEPVPSSSGEHGIKLKAITTSGL